MIISRDPKRARERKDELFSNYIALNRKIDNVSVRLESQTSQLAKELKLMTEMMDLISQHLIKNEKKTKKTKRKKAKRSTKQIPRKIFNIINEEREISFNKLYGSVKKGKICSKNTLYKHLGKMVKNGDIQKTRKNRKVYYSLPADTTYNVYMDPAAF